MSKRARFTGSEAIRVTWPPGQVTPDQEWIVEPNHLLPDDAPAAMRDELLKRDNWSEVKQSTSTPSKSEEAPADNADTPKES